VIDGIEAHGSDPITKYHMVESREKEYGWERRCVKCGFKKHNSESYYREEERVKKIAKRDLA
jgi:hypothetical protein